MRDLAVLVGLFLEAYRATLAADRARPKRKHILTEDGESLDVIADEAEIPRERLLR